jgi:hypothetical protein
MVPHELIHTQQKDLFGQQFSAGELTRTQRPIQVFAGGSKFFLPASRKSTPCEQEIDSARDITPLEAITPLRAGNFSVGNRPVPRGSRFSCSSARLRSTAFSRAHHLHGQVASFSHRRRSASAGRCRFMRDLRADSLLEVMRLRRRSSSVMTTAARRAPWAPAHTLLQQSSHNKVVPIPSSNTATNPTARI